MQLDYLLTILSQQIIYKQWQNKFFILFHMIDKPVPNNFGNIPTEHMTIRRVKTVNYLGLVIDENLYWNVHVEYVCASLVNTLEYLIISNHLLRHVYVNSYTLLLSTHALTMA